MSTKNNPDPFDCYNRAEPDEPRFTLLGRDPVSEGLLKAWAYLRSGRPQQAIGAIWDAHDSFQESGKPVQSADDPQIIDALKDSEQMRDYLAQRKINK